MTRSTAWIRRTAVALAVPALTVTTLGVAPAQAVKAPPTPPIAKVAKIYPHLAGGTAETESYPVQMPRGCTEGTTVKGAKAVSTFYAPADASGGLGPSTPVVQASAARFPNVKSAKKYFRAGTKMIAECQGEGLGEGPVDVRMKKIPFKAGEQSWARTLTVTSDYGTSVMHGLLARKGKTITIAVAVSTDKASPKKKAVKFAKLVFKRAV